MKTCLNSFVAVLMETIVNSSCQCETDEGTFLIGYRLIVQVFEDHVTDSNLGP
jgi:hypothetical protein